MESRGAIVFCPEGRNLSFDMERAETAVRNAEQRGFGNADLSRLWLSSSKLAWTVHKKRCVDCRRTSEASGEAVEQAS